MTQVADPTRLAAEPGAATRERILDASERLFATKGFLATSVRDITSEAGVNLAAINYHFGGKDNLYREMSIRRLRIIREQRMAAIRAAMDPPPERRTVEDLLRRFAVSFLEPSADWKQGVLFLQLFSREMTEPRLPRELVQEELVVPIEAAFVEALREIEPGIEESSARLYLNSLVGQVMHMVHMAGFYGTLEARAVMGFTFDDMIEHIVRFTAEGIRSRAGGLPA